VSDGADDLRPSVVPQLSVRRGRAAISFYEEAFAAIEVYRVGGIDDRDAVVERAKAAGATEVYPVSEELAGGWGGSRIRSATTG
jgi:uncharacterized glyoxalase superfamily protein PhnB